MPRDRESYEVDLFDLMAPQDRPRESPPRRRNVDEARPKKLKHYALDAGGVYAGIAYLEPEDAA